MKTGKIILWSLVALTIASSGVWAYRRFVWTKKRAIAYIRSKDADANADSLAKMDDGYVIARAKAYFNKEDTYTFNGKKYLTVSGKAA